MVPTLSVLDNVFLGSELGALGVLDRSAQREVYAGPGAESAFTADPDVRVSPLRVADQQKIEIMRALVRNARLIVMDEPTAALTREEALRLLDITRELAATGVTIVYVSHFLGDVLALCDTITVLKDGRHVHTVAAGDETPDSLVTAMIGRSLDLQFPPKRRLADGAPGGALRHGLARPGSTRSRSTSAPARSSASPGSWAAVAVRSPAPSSEPIRRRESSSMNGRTAIVTLAAGPHQARVGDAAREPQGPGPGDDAARQREHDDGPHARHRHGRGLNREPERKVVGERWPRRRPRRQPDDAGARPVGRNQQKVSLAKWLVETPRLLLADEPTRGIDVGAKLGIYEMLHRLAADGMGVLLISSEIEEVIGLAHRILVVREGRIVAEFDGDADEATVMRAAFGTDPVPTRQRGTTLTDTIARTTSTAVRYRAWWPADRSSRVRHHRRLRRAVRGAVVHQRRVPHQAEPPQPRRAAGTGGHPRLRLHARDHRR